MKISILNFAVTLLTLSLCASSPATCQHITSTYVSFGATNETLREALKKLGDQSGYIIFYPSEQIDKQPAVNLPFKERTMAATLTLLLVNTELDYKQQGDKVIVLFTPQKPKVTESGKTIISGNVADEDGTAMTGVIIKQKDKPGNNSVTNQQGAYHVEVADLNVVLQFSHVGFRTKEISAGTLRNDGKVTMESIAGALDEVQVTAYGSTTRRLNTGDQTTISAKEIEKYPSGNALMALQGTVPGLMITQASGTPGGTFSAKIRGPNSLNAHSDPFYVVDGIPYTGGGFASQRGNSVSSDATTAYDALSLINPLDIESINILKDADATAIYGSRAANGVILITTKRGKPGKPKMDLNIFSGISRVGRIPDVLNTREYLEMRREAKRNDNAQILPSDYDLNGTWDENSYVNFPELLLGGTSYTTNSQIGVSGGSNDLQYLISANYRNTSNVQKIAGGNDKTTSLHFNINTANPDSRFSMNFSGGYSYNKNTIPPIDLMFAAVTLAPNAPELFTPTGALNFENGTFMNPLLFAKKLANASIYNLSSSMVIGYKLLSGLNFQATLGYNKQSLDEFFGTPYAAIPPDNIAIGAKPSSQFSKDDRMYWSIEPLLIYNRNIAKGYLSATVGWSLQRQDQDARQLLATGYTSDLLLENIAAGTTIQPATPVIINEYKYNAIFGRLNYNWSNKYILSLSGRYDGSSKFGENKRFHFFPATAAAWLLSSEDFIKNLPFVSFAKLRASYGITGNDQFSYSYMTNYGLSFGKPYQGIPGVTPDNLPNQNLSWETVAKANLGLELKFLKNRIGIESNYFLSNTSDLMIQNFLSSTTGFASIIQNKDAKLQNRGFDVSLNSQNITSASFNWSTTVLFTKQTNELKKYPGLPATWQMLLGQVVDALPVYRYAGINQQTGLYQFYNADGGITNSPLIPNDLTEVVNTNPDYFGSLSNTFSYKGFSLSFMFRFVKQKGESVKGILSGNVYAGMPNYNVPRDMLDRWQKPGEMATYQKFSTSVAAVFQQSYIINSDANYGDASYIRLQNASLAYQFPARISDKLYLKNLKIYANGENIATITGYRVLDPENQSLQRIGPLRTVVFGIQASL